MQRNALQNKRELFFKNELPAAAGVTASNGSVKHSSLESNGGIPNGHLASHSTPASSSVPATPVTASISTLPQTVTPTTASLALHNKKMNERSENISSDSNDAKDKFNKIVEKLDKRMEKAPEKPEKCEKKVMVRELDGYVGFANFPNQVYRKAIKKGFEFTLMVVGESGLGKSTLINSLFLSDVYGATHPGPSLRIKKTVQVETSRCLLKEKGVNLNLTVVDTPGFGDAVDNSNCWQPVLDYIESRYDEYLNAESRVNRKPLQDSRVHACLYFIAPSGHGLKPLDVEFMKRLHDKVNIIPVIAKADTMVPEEIAAFKVQIMKEIKQHEIKIYEFPDALTDEDGSKRNKNLRDRVPFAVVGSNTVVEINGSKVRCRKYPWGVAEVENLEHCDFLALRDMMIRTHLQDIKDVTNYVHYENFRCRKLAGLGSEASKTTKLNKNPLATLEEEKREHDAKMKKMEAEMEQVFEAKVKEKKQKLKESEADMQKRNEQMRRSIEQQLRELQEKRKQLEEEKLMWEQANGMSLDELRRRSLERDSFDGKDKKTKKKGLMNF